MIAGTILAGIHVFIQRIAIARDYNSNLLNSYTGIVAGAIGLLVSLIWLDVTKLSWFMVLFATVNGAFYLLGSNLRMDAMRHIDTTILLPLHKFMSPLFALLFGILYFGEILRVNEWIGIGLGMIVPLLLISKAENKRQNNLAKGLLFMVISAAIVAANAAINKEGIEIFSSVVLFAAVSHLGSAIIGLTPRLLKKQKTEIDYFESGLLWLSLLVGIVSFLSFNALLFAFAYGGPLAIVYTIHSLYIVIPIVLSIIFFKEHWNTRKVVAIVASIAAIMLMR